MYVETCEITKSASEESYTINSESRRECEDIMSKIYKEDPTFWPEGLNVTGHHDLYMIREASTKRAIGFTGWQEFVKEGGRKVGYYTIGILPEYRHNGFAKEAVRKLISKKASGVDRVEAYIASHNTPSINLAERLGVNIIKSATQMSPAVRGMLLGGVGNTAIWDYMGQEGKQPWNKDYWQDNDRSRSVMAFMNALIGAGGGYAMGSGFGGLGKNPNAGGEIAGGVGALAMTPVKDWLVRSLPAAGKLPGMVENLSKPQAPSVVEWVKGMSPTAKAVTLGGAALGGLGLAYGGYKGVKAIGDLANSNRALAGGRLKVTLPSKDKYDHETTVDMPFSDINVSDNQKHKLTRDVRRRIYRETKERTQSRKKKPVKKEDESEKAASLIPVPHTSLDNIKALLNHIHHGY